FDRERRHRVAHRRRALPPHQHASSSSLLPPTLHLDLVPFLARNRRPPPPPAQSAAREVYRNGEQPRPELRARAKPFPLLPSTHKRLLCQFLRLAGVEH